MMTITIAAAAEQAPRGWGGPVGLLVALVLFLSFVGLKDRVRDGRLWPSPTPAGRGGGSGVRVNPQVRTHDDPDDPTVDPDADPDFDPAGGGFWQGLRRSIWARPGDDGDDLADDDEDEDDPDEQPAPPAGQRETPGETRQQAVARMMAAGCRHAEMKRYLMRTFRVSESTAKREIRVAVRKAKQRP